MKRVTGWPEGTTLLGMVIMNTALYKAVESLDSLVVDSPTDEGGVDYLHRETVLTLIKNQNNLITAEDMKAATLDACGKIANKLQMMGDLAGANAILILSEVLKEFPTSVEGFNELVELA